MSDKGFSNKETYTSFSPEVKDVMTFTIKKIIKRSSNYWYSYIIPRSVTWNL